MGKDKPKQHPKGAGASPDKLAKTKSKTDIQLTEDELRKASGGSGNLKIKVSY